MEGSKNTVDIPVTSNSEMVLWNKSSEKLDQQSAKSKTENRCVRTLATSVFNHLAHILMMVTVGMCIAFAFRNGLPLTVTQVHILLCVVGYHLLMAEAILSLAPGNLWSSKLKLLHKRRIHWILQVLGSTLAIIGSSIKIYTRNPKKEHWNSLHGRFALAAMVFTILSLVNGVGSLFSYELRRVIPVKISRLSHICCGIIAFSTASISLCFGLDKKSFRKWISDEFCYVFISVITIFACIVVINPAIYFYKKFKNL